MEFLFKLRPFLAHDSIDNCHLNPSTDDSNKDKSKHLANLLGLYISGNALSPFIDNPTFEDKGIEMLNHLMEMKHPVSKSSANNIYNSLSNQTIKPDESFDSFATRLRLMYKTCTRSGISYDEDYLVRCFIKGLDCNFDYSRELLSQGVLDWFDKPITQVLIAVTNVKLNKEADGSWITTTATANATGKQGAKRPTLPPNSPAT